MIDGVQLWLSQVILLAHIWEHAIILLILDPAASFFFWLQELQFHFGKTDPSLSLSPLFLSHSLKANTTSHFGWNKGTVEWLPDVYKDCWGNPLVFMAPMIFLSFLKKL